QGHDEGRDHQDPCRREEPHRAADLLNLLAELGLGEIHLVVEELGELRKCIGQEGRYRSKIGLGVHDPSSPCEDEVWPPDVLRKRTAANPASTESPRNAAGCRLAKSDAPSTMSRKVPLRIFSAASST